MAKTLIPALALVVLAGCMGGGSGGSPTVNTNSALGYFSDVGFGPPSLTQQEAANRQRWEFNTVIASDAVFLAPDGRLRRFHPRCAGDQCVVTISGRSVQTSSSDLGILEADTVVTPVMSGPGVHVARLQGQTDDGIASHGYGAWMEWNAFETGFVATLQGSAVTSGSAGWSTRTNPVRGPASWLGTMVGTDYSGGAAHLKAVQGLAALVVDFEAVNVDVVLSRITDLGTGTRHPDMRWYDLPMWRGTFLGTGIQGRFYGRDHEQAGGVFDRNRINGAFGVRRF